MPAFVSPIANFFSAGDTAEVAAISGSDGQAAALLEEYTEGAKIMLQIDDSFCEEFDEIETVEAVIEHVFQPFTQSVVLKVSYELHGQQTRAILKLYDRRGAKGFRTANHAVHDEWTPERERDYQAYMQADYNDEIKDQAIAFIDRNRGEAYFGAHSPIDSGDQQLTALFREAVFAVGIKYMMEREIEVYGALEPLQGSVVPTLYTSVSYFHPHSNGQYDEGFTSIGGLLLEYIEGTELVELFASGEIPLSQHQVIGDLAIAAVNEVSACGVLNCDVSTRNAIVRRDEATSEYSVVIYDFGIARTRNEFESDDAWLEIKWACMEVDKMGLELVDVANYEYDCIKPYDDKELNGDSATQLMREQQEYYKQCFFESWQRNPQVALIAS